MRKLVGTVSVISLLSFAACSSPRSEGGGSSRTTTSSTTASSPPTSVSPTTAKVAASGAIGVPECDAYLEKMRACIRDAPESERAKRTESVDAIEKQWREEARTGDTKATLPLTCKGALRGLDDEGSGCKR